MKTYTTRPRFCAGRGLSIRYNASCRVSFISLLSRAFVIIKMFCMLDRMRARPIETINSAIYGENQECDVPSCLLISLTPTAVSASCLVRLPPNSSSSSMLDMSELAEDIPDVDVGEESCNDFDTPTSLDPLFKMPFCLLRSQSLREAPLSS